MYYCHLPTCYLKLVPASDARTVTPSHTPTLGHLPINLPIGTCQTCHGSVKRRNFWWVISLKCSRLLDGGTLAHAQLEDRLAMFFAAPAALLYTSGYDANVGNGGAMQDSQ